MYPPAAAVSILDNSGPFFDTGNRQGVHWQGTALDPLGLLSCCGRICSSLKIPKGSPLCCDEDQASIEWKIGIDGRRTHLDLGFEQIPQQAADGFMPTVE